MSDSNKKILINAVSSKMGGALTYLKNLIQELEKTDFNNQYIICLPSRTAKEVNPKRIKILPVLYSEGSYLKRVWWDQVAIRKIIKKEKIDILFSIANFATLFCPVKQLLLVRGYLLPMPYFKEIIFAKYSFKRKVIFYLKQFLVYLSARSSNLVMFPTASMVEDFKKLYKIPEKKIVINHYGTYLEKFKKGINIKKKDFQNKKVYKFLYSTMYTERKNFSTLFYALNLLKKHGLKFQLITPADFNDNLARATSTYEEDKELLDNLQIKDNIIFTGKIPYEKIDSLYKKADIFLWPTLTESFGHPLIEAMASGLPIIASDIPVNREVCADSALYFEPLNPEDLVDKIKLVIANTKLREKLIEKSRERSKLFRWEAHVKRLLSIFQRLSKANS
ncbi:glycosyltransferase family 4 protein [Patescibacteria group bacterium]|nr:glycosyltransferase family 4 protein [Patescibacteria group bacterium]